MILDRLPASKLRLGSADDEPRATPEPLRTEEPPRGFELKDDLWLPTAQPKDPRLQPRYWSRREGLLCRLAGETEVGKILGTTLDQGTLRVRVELLPKRGRETQTRTVLAAPEDVEVELPKMETTHVESRRHPFWWRRAQWEIETNAAYYPRLASSPWDVEAPDSWSYNCIAHALGIHRRQVFPDPATLESFDALFEAHGFRRVNTGTLSPEDWRLQAPLEKVILFGRPGADGSGSWDPKHAIVQEEDGTWTSKNGGGSRVRIEDPRALGGGLYGEPTFLYVRARR